MKTITITDQAEIAAIIARTPYCTLALTGLDGHPYAIPMNFSYIPAAEAGNAHGTFYLHSGPHGSKVEMLRAHPEVCLTLTTGHELVHMHRQVACSYSMKSQSVVARGTAIAIEDEAEKREALMRMMRHFGVEQDCRPIAEPAIRNVAIWRVEADNLSCRSFGLRPSEL